MTDTKATATATTITTTTTSGTTLESFPSDATRTSPSHFISRSSSQSIMTSVTADLSSHTPLLCPSDSDPSQRPGLSVTPRSLNAMSRRRKRTIRDTLLRKRLRLLWMLKCGLEAFIGLWTVFNITRYFLSYSRYVTTQAQIAALALALSACLSLAFLGCAVLLSTSRTYLKRRIPPRASHVMRKSIRFIAASLLFAPAVANVVLLFVWRYSDNPEVAFKGRCHLDIDLLWSAFQDQCLEPSWGVWVALAFVRLTVTLVVLTAYLLICLSYGRTLKLSIPHRISALASDVHSSAIPAKREASIRQSKHRPSHSTLSSNVESTSPSAPPYHQAQKVNVTRSGSITSSEDDYAATRLPPPGLAYNNQNIEQSFDNPHSSDHHFDDSLIHSRVSDDGEEAEYIEPNLETYYALYPAYALYAPSSYTPYSYNLPPVPPTIGYNEFGQPYPPDEPLSMLNGIIRRMPTIESMGSRELGSVVTSSSMHTSNVEHRVHGSARSTMTFDRPPTRPISDLVTSASHGASTTTSSSRPNSFGARAELMASLGGGPAADEFGELVSGESGYRQGTSVSVSRSTTATSTSSGMTFHTATSGSLYSAG